MCREHHEDRRKGGRVDSHVGRVMLPSRGELWQGYSPCEGCGFPEPAAHGEWLALRSWVSLACAEPLDVAVAVEEHCSWSGTLVSVSPTSIWQTAVCLLINLPVG